MFDWLIPAAQAHEKWFTPVLTKQYVVPDYFYTVNPITVTAAIVVVTVVAAGFALDRKFERSAIYARFEKKIMPLRDYAAGALAIATAITLLFAAWRNVLFASNFPLPPTVWGAVLRGAEAAVGASLLIGLFTAEAAAGVLVLYAILFAMYRFPDQLEIMNFVGIGAFLLVFARGKYSLDWFLGKPILSTAAQRKMAYLFLRVTLGLMLLVLSTWNKYLQPGYHLALMDKFPNFNPYVILHQWLGWTSLTREFYIFLLFVVELIIAIFETFGFFTRVAAILLVPVFLGSTLFLPYTELIGHLPVVGTLFVLFVFGDTYHKHPEWETKNRPA